MGNVRRRRIEYLAHFLGGETNGDSIADRHGDAEDLG